MKDLRKSIATRGGIMAEIKYLKYTYSKDYREVFEDMSF
jgi:hypothetical protein